MNHRVVMTVLLAVSASVPGGAQAPVTALVNVSVIPMDRERVVAGQTVLVQGTRIVALGPVNEVRVPASATTIDGRGKYLLPGLADMHVHLPRNDPDRLFLYLANAVTTVRDMLSGPDGLTLKRRVETRELLGPRIYAARLVDGGRSGTSLGAIAAQIAAYKAEGYDFVKYYGKVYTGEVAATEAKAFDSVMAAARRVNMPVVGHIVAFPGVRPALRAQVGSIEHLWGYFGCVGFSPAPPQWPAPVCGPQQSWEGIQFKFQLDTAMLRRIALETRQAGVWNTPTLAGLSPYQAPETGTRHAAAFLGTLDSTGTVAVGKRADLVLLHGNPLQNLQVLKVPAGVIAAGRWLSGAELYDSVHAMSLHKDSSTDVTSYLKSFRATTEQLRRNGQPPPAAP